MLTCAFIPSNTNKCDFTHVLKENYADKINATKLTLNQTILFLYKRNKLENYPQKIELVLLLHISARYSYMKTDYKPHSSSLVNKYAFMSDLFMDSILGMWYLVCDTFHWANNKGSFLPQFTKIQACLISVKLLNPMNRLPLYLRGLCFQPRYFLLNIYASRLMNEWMNITYRFFFQALNYSNFLLSLKYTFRGITGILCVQKSECNLIFCLFRPK